VYGTCAECGKLYGTKGDGWHEPCEHIKETHRKIMEKTMKRYERENPFFHNYVFSEKDIKRKPIKIRRYPRLWFKPTYVQINDGYVFYFKISQGQYFLIKVEKEKLPYTELKRKSE
jgi:hypothetical protein